MGAKEYQRSELLSSDDATGDMFTLDFIKNIQLDTLVMINPVCPLVSPQDVLNALDEFKKGLIDISLRNDIRPMLHEICSAMPIPPFDIDAYVEAFKE